MAVGLTMRLLAALEMVALDCTGKTFTFAGPDYIYILAYIEDFDGQLIANIWEFPWCGIHAGISPGIARWP